MARFFVLNDDMNTVVMEDVIMKSWNDYLDDGDNRLMSFDEYVSECIEQYDFFEVDTSYHFKDKVAEAILRYALWCDDADIRNDVRDFVDQDIRDDMPEEDWYHLTEYLWVLSERDDKLIKEFSDEIKKGVLR